MNRRTFSLGLAKLSTAFDQEVTDALSELWREKYAHLDDAVFALAVERAIDTLTFWPKPAEFNAIVATIQAALGHGDPPGEEVWAAVKRKLARYQPETRNTAEALSLTPREAAALRQVGTLHELAHMERDDLEWKKLPFAAAYDVLGDRAAVCDRLLRVEAGRPALPGEVGQ